LISLDTNLLVRVITRDDPKQAEAALKRMEGQALFLPKTALLELEWVLRHTYQLSRETIAHTFTGLLDLQQLRIEDLSSVTRACAWHAKGMDFADALHLASSHSAERLITFDRRFSQQARKLKAGPPVEHLASQP